MVTKGFVILALLFLSFAQAQIIVPFAFWRSGNAPAISPGVGPVYFRLRSTFSFTTSGGLSTNYIFSLLAGNTCGGTFVDPLIGDSTASGNEQGDNLAYVNH